MQRKPNNFGLKYGNQENITKKKKKKNNEWISGTAKELEGFKEGPKAEIDIDLLCTTLKKYKIAKREAMIEYVNSGSRNSPPFMMD